MPPAFGILMHPIGKNMGAHIPQEALGVKSKSGSRVQQVLIVERILVLAQHLVQLEDTLSQAECFCSQVKR